MRETRGREREWEKERKCKKGRRHKVERNGEEKKKDTGESNEIMRDRK